MIPLALVTGFLGSGKTTLLRRLAECYRERRVLFVVNEFSEVDVDGLVLPSADEDVLSIAGGSIFCHCLVTEFVGTMRTVATRAATSEPEIDGVFVEASGIADPRVIVQLMAETTLDQDFRLGAVISVVEPGTLADLLDTLPNIRAQIAASTTVLLNKVDLYPDEVSQAAERQIHTINPAAAVVRTEYCAADLDPFGQPPPRDLVGEYARCVDPNYARYSVELPGPVMLADLKSTLEEDRRWLYRAKGHVQTERGLMYVDYSHAGLKIEPACRPVPSRMVFIGAGSAADHLVESAERVRALAAG